MANADADATDLALIVEAWMIARGAAQRMYDEGCDRISDTRRRETLWRNRCDASLSPRNVLGYAAVIAEQHETRLDNTVLWQLYRAR